MPKVTIRHSWSGSNRGYYIADRSGVSDADVKTIWNKAFPKGKDWLRYKHINFACIKSFVLTDSKIALSSIVMYDQMDKLGRGGIFRADIDIVTQEEYHDYLSKRLANLHLGLIRACNQWLKRSSIFQSLNVWANSSLFFSTPQVIFKYKLSPNTWQVTETLVLLIGLDQLERGHFIGFTSFALDYRHESPLISMPQEPYTANSGKFSFALSLMPPSHKLILYVPNIS